MLSISKICPSLAIGFYIKDKASYENFEQELTELAGMKDSFFSVFGRQRTKKQITLENQKIQAKLVKGALKKQASPPRSPTTATFLADYEQQMKHNSNRKGK